MESPFITNEELATFVVLFHIVKQVVNNVVKADDDTTTQTKIDTIITNKIIDKCRDKAGCSK
jgi:hypothetical protein